MKRKVVNGIPYDIIGKHVIFNHDNKLHRVEMEMGTSAAKTIDTYIRKYKRDEKDNKTILNYSNNKFGDYWKNCHMGEIKVTKEDDQIYLHIKYKNYSTKVECYKHPFHMASAILKGNDQWIREAFEVIAEFQSENLKAGVDYTISPKGVFLVTTDNIV